MTTIKSKKKEKERERGSMQVQWQKNWAGVDVNMETSNFWFPFCLYKQKEKGKRESRKQDKSLSPEHSLFPPFPFLPSRKRLRYILQPQTVWDRDSPVYRKETSFPSTPPGRLHPSSFAHSAHIFLPVACKSSCLQTPITDIQNCGFPTLVRDSSMRAWGELLSSKRTRVGVEGNPFSNLHSVLVAKGTLALSGRLRMAASPRAWLQECPKHRTGLGQSKGSSTHAWDKEITSQERNKWWKHGVLGGAGGGRQ